MMKTKGIRALSVLLTMLMLCMTMSIAASAETASFSYDYPVDGVEFRLYQVGEVQNDTFVLTGGCADYAVDLNASTDNEYLSKCAETLAAYVTRDQLEPVAEGTTADGTISFPNLEMGIYLLIGDTAIRDNVKWTASPVLFTVPQTDENGTPVWEITAGGKYVREELPETTEISVEKIWKDSGYESSRPESVEVQLLKDGVIYETQTLSDKNSWKYTWTDLDAAASWTVVEAAVPANYTVSIETNDGVAVITNTRKTTTPPSSNPPTSTTPETPTSKIPQTGQLWWPVGIMAVTGIGFVLIGLIRRARED